MVLSESKSWLLEQVAPIEKFLNEKLKLQLNPNKIFIKSLVTGVDFLGWIHFPDHKVLRKTTAKRMLRKLKENSSQATLASYTALTKHGNTYKLRSKTIKGVLLSSET